MKNNAARLVGNLVIAILALSLMFSVGYIAFGSGTGIQISEVIYDYADDIQAALDKAVITGEPVIFSNPYGDAVYKIGKTLIIPDGITIIGNGATILVDNRVATNSESGKAFTRLGPENGRYFPYNSFVIMSEGLKENSPSSTSSFSIDGLNFVIRDNAAVLDSVHTYQIPTTLFGIRYAENVTITNSSFSVFSDVQRSYTAFDAYSDWNNLKISNCTFDVITDASSGGVWLRNHGASSASGNSVIENCVFNKRSGDEALGIWSNSNKWIKNVIVQGCTFNVQKSAYSNPAHVISAISYVDNIVFENNNINVACAQSSVLQLRSSTQNGEIYVKGNNITVDDMAMHNISAVIISNANTEAVYVEGNTITVNSLSEMRKTGVAGQSCYVYNNEFRGTGLYAVTSYVNDVYYNEIESCIHGFEYFTNCVGNTIKSVSGQAVIPAISPDPSARKQILIADNHITSAPGVKCFIYTMPGTNYADITYEGNTLVGGRVYISTAGTAIGFSNNDFYLEHLDDIYAGNYTAYMQNNGFYSVSTGDSLITSVRPSKFAFNESVPVGTFIGLGKGVLYDDDIAGPHAEGELIGYLKISFGRDASSWVEIYSSGK